MTEDTYHSTRQDLRKDEARVAGRNRGNPPADSDVSKLKSVVDQKGPYKPEQIEQTKADLPLPDQPPTASDWTSADQRAVNFGSGRLEEPVSGENNSALRGPATASSSARVDGAELHQSTAPTGNVGRQGVDNLNDLPMDAKRK